MALYPLRCGDCGREDEQWAPMAEGPRPEPCECGGTLVRYYTVPALPKAFTPHYNVSVGQYVSSQREFDQALSRGADEASERLNMDHKYRRVDPDEAKAGTDEAGMDATLKKRRDLGLDVDTKRIIT